MKGTSMNQTFILLKPDALKRNLVEPILDMFEAHGFSILEKKVVNVTQHKIIEHYKEVIERLDLPHFQGAILAHFEGQDVLIAKVSSSNNTIEKVRQLIGATDPKKAELHTIRGKFGMDSFEQANAEKRMIENLIHASDSEKACLYETQLWFED
jgi:nucleoside-diphosphate kinase